jgi:hypothetical protein
VYADVVHVVCRRNAESREGKCREKGRGNDEARKLTLALRKRPNQQGQHFSLVSMCMRGVGATYIFAQLLKGTEERGEEGGIRSKMVSKL